VLATLAALASGTAWSADIKVIRPQPQEVVHSNNGTVAVVAVDVPDGVRLQPVLDGETAGPAVEQPAFELQSVARGAHTLQLQLLDAQGRELGRSAPVSFQVWQASARNR
jgi:hypothetical protein